jgi:putative transposase
MLATRPASSPASSGAMAGNCESSSAGSVFAIAGLTWIVERSFAWLGFNRRLAKDYERRVQTSETLISIAVICLMLNRIAPA